MPGPHLFLDEMINPLIHETDLRGMFCLNFSSRRRFLNSRKATRVHWIKQSRLVRHVTAYYIYFILLRITYYAYSAECICGIASLVRVMTELVTYSTMPSGNSKVVTGFVACSLKKNIRLHSFSKV